MHLLTRIADFARSVEPLVDISAIDRTVLGTERLAETLARDAATISRRRG